MKEAQTGSESMSIVLTDLSIGYGAGRRTAVVARGMNAVAAPGRLTCLLGRNGTGKSTLLRTIAGGLAPLSGAVTIGAISPAAMSRKERARTIAVVATGRDVEPMLTVRQVVGLARTPYTGFLGRLTDRDDQIVAAALRSVGMPLFAERRFGELSDGEAQKVLIAKALAQRTPVVLMDEPTAFLDYPAKVETFALMRRLARAARLAVVVSTHDIPIAADAADELWTMSDGALSVLRPGTDVANEQLERLFSFTPKTT